LASQLGTYGEEEMEQPGSGLDQGGLEPPVKARKENTGRGNSSKSAKGYLYYQGRNETGRKSCTLHRCPWSIQDGVVLTLPSLT
jgi:hypothetical protein